MNMQQLTKDIADQFMKFKGEVRGVSLKNYGDFILEKEGIDGIKRIEDALVKVGYPLNFSELKTMNFYHLGYQPLLIVAMETIFNYDEKKFYELGVAQTKISLIAKIFISRFFSLQKLVKEVPNIWTKSYSVGKLEVIELNEKKKYIKLKLSDFPCHPMQCGQTLRGYLPTILGMITKGRPTCEETKCVFHGDLYHEYILRW